MKKILFGILVVLLSVPSWALELRGDCDSGDKNALSAQWDNGVCRIKSCNIGFRVDKQNNVCITRNGDDCTSTELKKYPGAVSGSYLYENGMETCVDLKCDDAYKTNSDATKCIKKQTECTSEQKAQHPFATEWGIEPGTENCVALECMCGYKLDEIAGKCIEKSESEKMCNKHVKPYLPANATKATMQCFGGKEVCIIPDGGCATDYDLDKPNNRCIKKVGKECTIPGDNNHVKRAVYQKVNGILKCVIKECEPDWDPNGDGTECKQVSGECVVTDDEYVSSDKRGTLKKGKCIPNACIPGYKVVDGVCTVSQCKCGEREEGNKCVKLEGDSLKCTPLTASPKAPANAEYGKITCPNGENGKEVCQIDEKSCKAGFKADVSNNRCISEQGLPCNDVAKTIDSNATLGEFDVLADGSKQCKITKCIENWAPNGDETKCIRVSGPCPDDDLKAIEYATAGEWRDSKCFATECEKGYKPNKSGKCIANPCGCKQKLVNNKCVDKTENELACTYTSVPKLHSNAATGVIACNAQGKEYCKVLTCKDNYEKNNEETKCISTKNDKCEFTGDTKDFVKTARYRERNKDMVCVITACIDGYMVDEKSNTCIVSEGPCSDAQIKAIDKATSGQLKKGKCYPTQCEPGYEPNGDKCVQIGGECTPDEDINATVGVRKFNSDTNTEWCKITGCVGGYDPNEDGTACVVNAEEQKKIEEAQKKYDAAKENEQSLGNRTLGAATMGAMGVGGMMVAQSLAEQNADADAERDMAAYLATFKCDYGAGMNIKGGATNVELPGANELIPLYAEYVALANDLKARKSQLGLKSGIESEKILDSATTGLYDDVSTGITSGAYASLARAMMSPNGEDAKKWAEQKEKTAESLKTGAITAGAGAAIGLIGNIISSEVFKNKMKNLKSVSILQETVDAIPEKQVAQRQSCPSNSNGTFPNCDCGLYAIYNGSANQCDKCPENQTAKENKCGCWIAPHTEKDGDKCVEPKKECVYECEEPTTENNLVRNAADCTCGCIKGFDYKDKKCQPQTPSQDSITVTVVNEVIAETVSEQGNNQKVKEEVVSKETELNEAVLGEAIFDFGKSTLTSVAKKALDDFAKNLKETDKVTKCDIVVSGFTDRAGNSEYNMTLSQERANSVKNHLASALSTHGVKNNMTAKGYGETQCFCVAGSLSGWKACNGKKAGDVARGYAYQPCRVVKIKAQCETEQQVETTQQ